MGWFACPCTLLLSASSSHASDIDNLDAMPCSTTGMRCCCLMGHDPACVCKFFMAPSLAASHGTSKSAVNYSQRMYDRVSRVGTKSHSLPCCP